MSPAEKARLETVVETPDLLIQRTGQCQPGVNLAVVFVSAALEGEDMTYPDFLKPALAYGGAVLFITDMNSAYYSKPGLVDRVVETVRAEMDLCGCRAVSTFGFSMGAYGAIAFAERLPVQSCLALAPRFTPMAAIIPDRRRHRFLSSIKSYTFPTLEAGWEAVGDPVLVHGSHGPDLNHIPRFRAKGPGTHLILPGSGHYVSGWIKKKGGWNATILAAFKGDTEAMRRELRRIGATGRASRRAQRSLRFGRWLIRTRVRWNRLRRILTGGQRPGADTGARHAG